MTDLESLGIARHDMAIAGFVHVGIDGGSMARLSTMARLERFLIASLRELVPDSDRFMSARLYLSETCQALRDNCHPDTRPDIVEKLLRGKDLQVETMIGGLLAALTGDLELKTSGVHDMTRLMEGALLSMHEQVVVTPGRGLTVFRPAMTSHLNPARGNSAQAHFLPLEDPDLRLCATGDDDQEIFAFKGASINSDRALEPAGGVFAPLDPVGQRRVQYRD